MKDYKTQIATLKADIATLWKLQCQNLYNSKNLGALAVRECLQNSIDAIRTAEKNGDIAKGEGYINISWENNDLIVEDNGVGMNLQTIHDKFLTLGGSTKGNDNVGGFGLAKSVILGCGTGFKVETQDNVFTDEDLGVNPIQKQSYRHGTRITLKNVQVGKGKTLEDEPERFRSAVYDYVFASQIPEDIRVTVNGEDYESCKVFTQTPATRRTPAVFNITKDIIPRDTKLRINIYKTEDSFGYLYVRLRGLTQFKQYLSWNADFQVVVDIDTRLHPRDVDYPFSTNREGLKSQYQGILLAISDKVSKSPIAISDHSNYKETLYDNTSSSAERNRIIATHMISKDLVQAANTVSKVVANAIPEGSYSVPSVAEKIQHLNILVEKTADAYDMTKDEVVKGLNTENLQTLNNPLDYSWIVWHDKDTKVKRITTSTQVSFILVWDSILRLMASYYPKLGGNIFYPGIVIRNEYMGLCLEKHIPSCGMRHYIMMNPYLIPKTDDMSIALYLMGLASHELAHLACGTYEAHGETWAYTREAIMNANLKSLSNIIKLVKVGKLRKTLSKITQRQRETTNVDCPIDFTSKTIDNIISIAESYNVDVRYYQNKYHNEPILRMRLIMAIKKNYKEE